MQIASDCKDCSLIVEILVWLWRLQSDCRYCCLINEIGVWLCRLQSDCGDCRLKWVEGERFLNRRPMLWIFLNPVLSSNQRPQFWALNHWEASISSPPILTHFQYKTAMSAIRTQSPNSDYNTGGLQCDCWDCSLIAEMAVWLLRLQFDFGS